MRWTAPRVGQIEAIADVGTDANRLRSFTPELVEKINTLGTGYPWRFKHFKKTDGYANSPLDGIWLRGPYLHNGSVPTLWHLLRPDERPTVFYRGSDLLDGEKVGFDWNKESEAGVRYFKFDTTLRGNGNGGHRYGEQLTQAQKEALLEYLKTL